MPNHPTSPRNSSFRYPKTTTKPYRPASGRSILRHAGTWAGDDYDECLQSVHATRGKAKFDYDLNPFE